MATPPSLRQQQSTTEVHQTPAYLISVHHNISDPFNIDDVKEEWAEIGDGGDSDEEADDFLLDQDAARDYEEDPYDTLRQEEGRDIRKSKLPLEGRKSD